MLTNVVNEKSDVHQINVTNIIDKYNKLVHETNSGHVRNSMSNGS